MTAAKGVGPIGSIDVSITIGGDAGQGIESSGAAWGRAVARSGLHLFSMADYRSRIRGGHNFYQTRAANRPVASHSDPVHLLMALTEETVKIHLDNVQPGGFLVYDEGFRRVDAAEIQRAGVVPLPLPLAAKAADLGSKVMMNTLVLGVAAGLLDFDLTYLQEVIEELFSGRSRQMTDSNVAALEQGWQWGQQHQHQWSVRLPAPGGAPRLALNGNQAFSLGAAAGDCRFMAAYPMTPATSIFEWFVAHSRQLGVVTKHAEDEIAAICMAIGASHAGVRSMTATSGAGLALMSEAIGLAGMVELPLVVVVSQRGGPSTGLPTRTEQGDLLFAIHASQGEFPRLLLAPGTVEDCFTAGWRAFNLADQYQTPVIVLLDQFVSSAVKTVADEDLDLNQVAVERGATWGPADLEQLDQPYHRFALTSSGISPRAIPGHPQGVYALTSDEHDEEGHISEELGNRVLMMRKRMRKEQTALNAQGAPVFYGPLDSDLTLVCWGSTVGACREALELLQAQKVKANVLHFTDLWPMPRAKVRNALANCRRTLAVEQNYTGQLARLLRQTVGFTVDATLHKYDGRPYTPQDVAAYAQRVLADLAPTAAD